MIPQERKYFVIIVHYGPIEATKVLLEDIRDQTTSPDHVVVIDHSWNIPDQAFSQSFVSVIRPAENYGYAAGLTIGLGFLHSRGAVSQDIVICMNNDVRLEKYVVETIKRHANAQKTPSWIVSARIGYLHYLTGRCDISDSFQESKVSWVYSPYPHGSFFATPFKTFADVQGLPEKYFLYWEDVAFGYALFKKGYSLRSIEGVIHPDEKTKTMSDDKLYYLVRNGAWFLSHMNNGCKWYWQLLNMVRRMYHAAFHHNTILTALQDAQRGKLGKRTI